MKVCQFIDQLKGGGQERVAVEFANQLAKRGLQSSLLATRSGGDYAAQVSRDVDLKIMTRIGKWDLSPWIETIRWLRSRDFDLVQAHSVGSLFWAGGLRLAARLRFRIIYHLQMLPAPGWWRRVTLTVIRLFRGQVSLCFVTNDGLRNCLVAQLGFAPGRVEFLMNPTVFPVNPPLREMGSSDGVVMVAQWRRQKDFTTAIRAAALMRERGYPVKWSFLGAEEDADLVQSAREEIERLGVGDLVFICGRRADVRAELAKATAGVLSTYFEGQPVALIEYCASALPVVVSDVDGTSQLVSPENGVIGVPPGDAGAMADAIIRLVASPDRGRGLGIRAYHYMKARADADVVFSQVIRDYEKVIEDP